ncbi:Tripartite-type tricarboxylate transporter, receptor component TctC [Enhydrobacter aerosaccus]|uniref:Tripartite-type tricarboxylate transporter, receptor component TctC n=1 Tax=Enhydrobacter aerosaccus TaxID=225324 RepID=A0A1T4MVB8_9HYPH|nr:tripartite tricarboxylate transporter substrate binding protein [Enhydrobacter aerosaccus]SJZ71060.1 Tripartite-type tricarboxylate transporter, receptor component TctC [Enhydrobacter aerosaccus]
MRWRWRLRGEDGYRQAMPLSRRTLLAASLAVPLIGTARADTYPDRPIRLVVPFAPGGNADLTGRVFGEALGQRLGQQVVIDNRGGAGGAIGAEQVAKASPDGYTLVLGSTGTFLVSPRMTGSKPPYSLANFAPVALLSTSAMVIEVTAKNEIKDWPAMLAYLKANPGKLSIGHPGNGSSNHLAVLRLQQALGVRFNTIPYKSNGLALNDLLAGQIDAVIDQVPASIGHIREGRLRAIAVTTAKRARELPDTPTLAELGVTGFDAATPIILMAPAGTPAEIVAKLNATVNQSLSDPAVGQRLNELGADTEAMTPQALGAMLQREDAGIVALEAAGLLKAQ